MEKENIIQLVVGFALTGWLTYVTTGVGEGKHERDIQGQKIQMNKERVEAANGSTLKLWDEWDEKNKKERDEMRDEMTKEMTFALELINRINELEVEVEKLKANQ